jgi:hypothetical protein
MCYVRRTFAVDGTTSGSPPFLSLYFLPFTRCRVAVAVAVAVTVMTGTELMDGQSLDPYPHSICDPDRPIVFILFAVIILKPLGASWVSRSSRVGTCHF